VKLTEDFDDIWSVSQKRLMAGTLVRYWSTEKGYIGDAFCVDSVTSAGVIAFGTLNEHVRSRKPSRLPLRAWLAFVAEGTDYVATFPIVNIFEFGQQSAFDRPVLGGPL
jgi:hypothetical protein